MSVGFGARRGETVPWTAAVHRLTFSRMPNPASVVARCRPGWAGRWFRLAMALVAFVPLGAFANPPRLSAIVPGLMRIIPPTQHPILFFGEDHGSEQMPAFFGDAVATVSKFKRTLVILEQNRSESRFVSRYVSGQISMAEVVDSGEWRWASTDPQQREDGRHSIAMVKLLYRLRQLSKAGRVIRIGGTNADKLPAHVTYNVQMAENIRQLSKAFAGVTMVYTGTAHAKKKGRRAANLLPSRRTVSITAAPVGRTIVESLWICRMKHGGIFCGLLKYRHEHVEAPARYCGAFGIHRSSPRRVRETGFDAYACVGGPITASPPATLANAPAWRE